MNNERGKPLCTASASGRFATVVTYDDTDGRGTPETTTLLFKSPDEAIECCRRLNEPWEGGQQTLRWKTVDNATARVSGAWRLTVEDGVWSLSRDGRWLCDYASEAEAKAIAETAEKAHQQKGLD